MTREEAIKGLKSLVEVRRKYFDMQTMKDEIECLEMAIKALEQTRWIPVDEKLPEKEGQYLTTIINEYDNRLRYTMTCDYFPNDRWCPDDECASSNVVAWMPSPEPYNAESEE